jgi:hypothetical protein
MSMSKEPKVGVGEKTVLSTNGAEKTGFPLAEN